MVGVQIQRAVHSWQGPHGRRWAYSLKICGRPVWSAGPVADADRLDDSSVAGLLRAALPESHHGLIESDHVAAESVICDLLLALGRRHVKPTSKSE